MTENPLSPYTAMTRHAEDGYKVSDINLHLYQNQGNVLLHIPDRFHG